MSKMTAYRMLEWGRKPEFVEVDRPTPGPGEVLIKMGAVGLCHSDITLQDSPAGMWPFDPPFTLGHENAGWIAELGNEVHSLEVGTPVLVASPRSCGVCAMCLQGDDNYCVVWSPKHTTRGVGLDGGLAAYMVAPAREVVALDKVSPTKAAVLGDAGTTSYRAVRSMVARLAPGSTAVVIGTGGLGGFAVQYLSLLTQTRIIAVDQSQTRLDFAKELGAHETLLSDESVGEAIMDLTGGKGAEGVFDFVGADSTLELALKIASPLGRITLCGAAGGRVPIGFGAIAGGCEFVMSYGSTLKDLREVVALAEGGRLRIETENFAFADLEKAYEKLREGSILSRALIEMP